MSQKWDYSPIPPHPPHVTTFVSADIYRTGQTKFGPDLYPNWLTLLVYFRIFF